MRCAEFTSYVDLYFELVTRYLNNGRDMEAYYIHLTSIEF
jgi:hypothetical protein